MGDVLTWSVKSVIKAKKAGCKDLDIYICADVEEPSCVLQCDYINSKNYSKHLEEILPAFRENPYIRQIHVFEDRKELQSSLLKTFNEINSTFTQSYILSYFNIRKTRQNRIRLLEYYKSEITRHTDINDYYHTHNYQPELCSPCDLTTHIDGYKKKYGEDRIYVSLNFRLRQYDKTSNQAILSRDSNLEEWIAFLEKCNTDYPNIVFILLGKLEEKPSELLKLENLIIPRLSNQHLGHELAWIQDSDFFMGSSSGFAAKANFSKTPYIITKIGKLSTDAYDIEYGDKTLPFSIGYQKLIYENESAELLMTLVQEWLQASNNISKAKIKPIQNVFQNRELPKNRQSKNPMIPKISLTEIEEWIAVGDIQKARNSLNITLFRSIESFDDQQLFYYLQSLVLYELGEYPEAKSEFNKINKKYIDKEHSKLLDKINARLLLENLDRFLARNTDAADSFMGIEKIRAKCFLTIEDYPEANNSITRHSKYFPDDPEVKSLKSEIESKYKSLLSEL